MSTSEAKALPWGESGWCTGHFDEAQSLSVCWPAVTVTCSIHPDPEKRGQWRAYAQGATLIILLRGRFSVGLADGTEALLTQEGDFVMCAPGMPYRPRSLGHGPAVVLTMLGITHEGFMPFDLLSGTS